MTQEVCLDANVFVTSFVRELNSDACLRLLQLLEENGTDLYEPPLLVPEITSALYRKVQNGECSNSQMDLVLDLFSDLPVLIAWQPFVSKKAANLAFKLNFHTPYDSFYLAVAESRDIPLISQDKDFLSKAKTVYPKTYSVQEYLQILFSQKS